MKKTDHWRNKLIGYFSFTLFFLIDKRSTNLLNMPCSCLNSFNKKSTLDKVRHESLFKLVCISEKAKTNYNFFSWFRFFINQIITKRNYYEPSAKQCGILRKGNHYRIEKVIVVHVTAFSSFDISFSCLIFHCLGLTFYFPGWSFFEGLICRSRK